MMLGFDRFDLRLIWNFIKMNLRDKYLGTSLGTFWALINPLLMLGIYTFIFGFVFKVKLPGAETTLTYVIWLISGYGPWMALSEATMSATTSVVSGSGMVKNMVFKVDILPVAAALTSIVPLAISLTFIVILMIVDGKPVSPYVLTLPLVIALQFLLVIGIGFFCSVIHVFVRDFGTALPNILMVIMFITPIFYPLEGMPRLFQILSRVNPIYALAEGYRAPLIHGKPPDFVALFYVFVLAAVLCVVGLRVFRRAKGFFTSML
jgi:lipopolysaccharide transport system permease protein